MAFSTGTIMATAGTTTLPLSWQNFSNAPLWSGLFSGLFVAVIFSLFFPWIAERWKRFFNKPRLHLWNAATNDASCVLLHLSLNEWGYHLNAIIKNDSNVSIDHLYYNIAVPVGLEVNYNVLPDSGVTATRRDSINGTFLAGEVMKPLYPYRSFRFPFTLDFKAVAIGTWEVYYCFSTKQGLSPGRAKNMPVGEEIEPKDMGKYFDKFTVRTG